MDPCIKPSLSELGTIQAKPTADANKKAKMLMDYLQDHPDAVFRYCARDMILHFETGSAYLVLPLA